MKEQGALTICAVVPTRNRPADLKTSVQSILRQVRPPDEVIIVDQSTNDESARSIPPMFADYPGTRLTYLHDPAIAGLVDAKRVAAGRATADVVCFLEDDIVLEPNYLAEIERAFQETPGMYGCGGVVTNPPRTSRLYLVAHALFFRGIFRDPRPRLSLTALHATDQLLRCDVLHGGNSAWRRAVFSRVPFDTANGFFMFEDMEFSTRVVRTFGHCLYINANARMEHNFSPANRDVQSARQRRKLAEAMVFYKKRRSWPGAWVGVVLAFAWWLLEAFILAFKFRSLDPVAGYFHGVADGLRRPLVT